MPNRGIDLEAIARDGEVMQEALQENIRAAELVQIDAPPPEMHWEEVRNDARDNADEQIRELERLQQRNYRVMQAIDGIRIDNFGNVAAQEVDINNRPIPEEILRQQRHGRINPFDAPPPNIPRQYVAANEIPQPLNEEALRQFIGGEVRRNVRRGAQLVREEDGRVAPRNLVQEEEHRPPPARKAAVKRIPQKKIEPMKVIYPEGGVPWLGHIFSRKLSSGEDNFLRNYGYLETIRKIPELLFKEKEKPVDENEEVIVTISELADYYATEECKCSVANFNIKEHNKEYQTAYKKHVIAIAAFKRNKNG